MKLQNLTHPLECLQEENVKPERTPGEQVKDAPERVEIAPERVEIAPERVEIAPEGVKKITLKKIKRVSKRPKSKVYKYIHSIHDI